MTDYFDLWKLLAGLGLFLFAMNLLELALKQLAGNRFRRFLRRSTDNPLQSAFGGIVATAIVQSSSLVGLIVLAFVGAGIIPLVNAIGIVLGSNLGTTFTGWIVATIGFKLDLNTLVYPLAALGGLSYGLFRTRLKAYSQIVLSIALLLMGLGLMKDSVGTLTQLVDVNVLHGYPLIVYLFTGVLFTAIIQSSSATMMLTLGALYADIIPLPAAAALVIGADLGTTSTVLLGSLQGAVAKRQLAMAHVLFNLTVDTLAFISLHPLLSLIERLALSDPLYSLVAFHSLFNLFGLILFLPLLNRFASLLQHWIKEDEQHIKRYIDTVPVDETDAALEAVSLETRHLIQLVTILNLRFLGDTHLAQASDSASALPGLLPGASKLEHYIAIKKLEGEIVSYALKIDVNDEESIAHRIDSLIDAVRSAVYSAKSLKDIDQNLEVFRLTDNRPLTTLLDNLTASARLVFVDIDKLLNNAEALDILDEELSRLKQDAQQVYDEFSDNFYEHIEHIPLKALDLSSLLNVNKEIHTSQKALIKSLSTL